MKERAAAMRTNWYRRYGIRWLLALMVAVFFFFAVNYPLPYYVTRPGSAVELGPIIKVEGGERDEQGAFMLTTVRMGQATPFWYLYTKFSPDAELIEINRVLLPGESNEEFIQRERYVMENSQLLASAVAFRLAGYEVKVENEGVTIVQAVEGSPSDGLFKPGDVVTQIDDTPIRTMQELLAYLSTKQPGDRVKVTYQRGEKQQAATVALTELAQEQGETSRAGLGVRGSNKQAIEIPKKVTVSSRNIGGPSAGLMMTLEIYDQLDTSWNATRGYRIAGTGEIFSDGAVGRIGGINHKVIAADTAEAEIFFAPDDEGSGLSNYDEALATAKRIGTSMQIVPVKTVEDAINYLKSLEPK
ncbi:PDZ domain-containing protein [Brevibacillus humidisoli]|uniref:SepM family pheromone-processing serine protease n=1 Tax=Brevibacillus humidisoli TaxID=2895522 RepID=UPI001E5BDC33|nr:SepM family pheromone-processing serine protease [Brevibacillus humidisoli]UFJ42067.1 PDZ domain-containing protein [Brevibacillus humidisoli]